MHTHSHPFIEALVHHVQGGGALGRPVGDEVPRRISARFDLSPCPANDAGKRGTVVPQLSALMALLSQMAFWNHSGEPLSLVPKTPISHD